MQSSLIQNINETTHLLHESTEARGNIESQKTEEVAQDVLQKELNKEMGNLEELLKKAEELKLKNSSHFVPASGYYVGLSAMGTIFGSILCILIYYLIHPVAMAIFFAVFIMIPGVMLYRSERANENMRKIFLAMEPFLSPKDPLSIRKLLHDIYHFDAGKTGLSNLKTRSQQIFEAFNKLKVA